MFQTELEVYRRHQAELQAANPGGGFVVIMGNEILGIWQSRVDALKAGIDRYGNVEFLVKNIIERDAIISFSRNLAFL